MSIALEVPYEARNLKNAPGSISIEIILAFTAGGNISPNRTKFSAPNAGGKAVAITITSTAASVSDGLFVEKTSENAPFASVRATQQTARSGLLLVSSIAATCVEIN